MAMHNYLTKSYIHAQRPLRFRPESREHLDIREIFKEMATKCNSRHNESSLTSNPVQKLLDQGKMVEGIKHFIKTNFSDLEEDIEFSFILQRRRNEIDPPWEIYQEIAITLIIKLQQEILEENEAREMRRVNPAVQMDWSGRGRAAHREYM
jgi:hypothetical protein